MLKIILLSIFSAYSFGQISMASTVIDDSIVLGSNQKIRNEIFKAHVTFNEFIEDNNVVKFITPVVCFSILKEKGVFGKISQSDHLSLLSFLEKTASFFKKSKKLDPNKYPFLMTGLGIIEDNREMFRDGNNMRINTIFFLNRFGKKSFEPLTNIFDELNALFYSGDFENMVNENESEFYELKEFSGEIREAFSPMEKAISEFSRQVNGAYPVRLGYR